MQVELVGLTIVMYSTSRKLIVVVKQVPAVWRAFGVVGQVVVAFDSAVNSGETCFVSVVCGGPLVVDDDKRIVLWLTGTLAVSKPVNTIASTVGCAFNGFLDEVRV